MEPKTEFLQFWKNYSYIYLGTDKRFNLHLCYMYIFMAIYIAMQKYQEGPAKILPGFQLHPISQWLHSVIFCFLGKEERIDSATFWLVFLSFSDKYE